MRIKERQNDIRQFDRWKLVAICRPEKKKEKKKRSVNLDSVPPQVARVIIYEINELFMTLYIADPDWKVCIAQRIYPDYCLLTYSF